MCELANNLRPLSYIEDDQAGFLNLECPLKNTTLDKIPENTEVCIINTGSSKLQMRLAEIGIIPGENIFVLQNTSLGIIIRVLETKFAIRQAEAREIKVVPLANP
jgi:Fe2+ transport system protein FeoA